MGHHGSLWVIMNSPGGTLAFNTRAEKWKSDWIRGQRQATDDIGRELVLRTTSRVIVFHQRGTTRTRLLTNFRRQNCEIMKNIWIHTLQSIRQGTKHKTRSILKYIPTTISTILFSEIWFLLIMLWHPLPKLHSRISPKLYPKRD